MKTTALLILSLLYFCACACSEDKAQPESTSQPSELTNQPPHQTYHEWHSLCLQGDKKTIDQQIDKFEQALETNPNDHLARAYLGSANALRAKASFWGPSKLKYLNKGKKGLDAAVAAAPKDLRVRMVRAIGYYKVPKKFKVRPTAVKDFEILVNAVIEKNCPLKTNEKQAVLYYAHLTFAEENHSGAAKAKKLCHRLAPHSKYGKLTR